MSDRRKTGMRIALVVVVLVVLFLIFPAAFAFVGMAARNIVYLWWLILLIALGIWLIWGIGRSPK